jgi:hypothetical protein
MEIFYGYNIAIFVVSAIAEFVVACRVGIKNLDLSMIIISVTFLASFLMRIIFSSNEDVEENEF